MVWKPDELGPVIYLGRRTVGLHKIDQADIVRMKQYGGAKSEEEEKVLATKEYLQLEIKLLTGWKLRGSFFLQRKTLNTSM